MRGIKMKSIFLTVLFISSLAVAQQDNNQGETSTPQKTEPVKIVDGQSLPVQAPIVFSGEGKLVLVGDKKEIKNPDAEITHDQATNATTLTFNGDDYKIVKTWSTKVSNFSTFYMILEIEKNKKFHIFKGTYVEGEDLNIYSGDIFEISDPQDMHIGSYTVMRPSTQAVPQQGASQSYNSPPPPPNNDGKQETKARSTNTTGSNNPNMDWVKRAKHLGLFYFEQEVKK